MRFKMYWLSIIVLVAIAKESQGQATAQSSVAPELRECYINGHMLNHNNFPPTSMPVLIDIIRKIETNQFVNLDLRMLATQLLHTYRQDGIEYHQPNTGVSSDVVLPYAPTFHSFHRHRMVLRMIPSNLQTLSNNTLPSILKCAVHYMLSSTVDGRVRGDEDKCGSLAQYRVMRTSRFARSPRPSIDEDVELLDLDEIDADSKGRMTQFDLNTDAESANSKSSRQVLGGSSCPILTGVVHTRWGPVSAGNLIAGIAAGAESQQVSLTQLTKGSEINYQNVDPSISTIYPATLSGDLAEAILVQGTRGISSVSVGNVGMWNSSQGTRHYMLRSQNFVEMTDPEIRGDLDGFILGTTLQNTLNTFGSLQLSQLLDMYYSPTNGVLNPSLRACNRKELSRQYVVENTLTQQTKSFAAALDTMLPLQGTLQIGLDDIVSSAVSNLMSYITSINDLTCDNSLLVSGPTRLKTDLYIALDASWSYASISAAISYLLDAIEVGQHGSSITLLSAFDGRILINQTNSLADFHSSYTLSAHESFMTGVNILNSYKNIFSIMQNQLIFESNTSFVGGRSKVLLFLLNTANVPNNEELLQEAKKLREQVPDLKVLYATASNQATNLEGLVDNVQTDATTISIGTAGEGAEVQMQPVFLSISNVGRRLINPLCGADFVGEASGTRDIVQYIEPGYVTYYRISPNYFYDDNENSRVRISTLGTVVGPLTICHSRDVQLPNQQNSTTSNNVEGTVTCQTLTSSGNVEISLANACSDYYTIGSCPPLFISVEAAAATGTLTATCTNFLLCRFPYDIQYQVQIQDLRCFSSATNIAASVTFLLFGLIINLMKSL